MITNLKHWAVLTFAVLCIIAGLATIWLPIPTGVPLLALGSFLIIANSRVGRNFFRRLRKHVSWLDHALLWLEERTGRTFGRVLKTTRPLVTRHRRRAELQSLKQTPDQRASGMSPRSGHVVTGTVSLNPTGALNSASPAQTPAPDGHALPKPDAGNVA
ncbi:hypothetical protein SAMN04515647_2778 [Cohaesibacter sp. ES.047]|uniref:hypothetical protein n=1 Tax=Cohaesibacter sp. ES.047 TaxID=1798205 RepID=UPI000BC00EF6|nr:hypothetical protein [Cohaesibacter sp. ES.047]SNY92505.1 hypothetical protein SAMN04515647_2778 [Cohaesibacter sp. ES.047]